MGPLSCEEEQLMAIPCVYFQSFYWRIILNDKGFWKHVLKAKRNNTKWSC